MRLEFFEDAASEIEEDRGWYRQRSESAEAGFLREPDHAVQQVNDAPAQWPHYLASNAPPSISKCRDIHFDVPARAFANARPNISKCSGIHFDAPARAFGKCTPEHLPFAPRTISRWSGERTQMVQCAFACGTSSICKCTGEHLLFFAKWTPIGTWTHPNADGCTRLWSLLNFEMVTGAFANGGVSICR